METRSRSAREGFGVRNLPGRSELGTVLASNAFWWMSGFDDVCVSAPHPRTARMLDQYELVEHYERQLDDLDLVASLGVPVVRYGLPWYRLEPAPGRFVWDFADRSMDALEARGLQPILSLVHYGTPSWLEGSFVDPDFPNRVAELASAVAQRYRGRVRWFAPILEPRIAAYYGGYLGHWPPYRRGWPGFLGVLSSVCQGIQKSVAALRQVDPEIVVCHFDSADYFEVQRVEHHADRDLRQETVFLPLDLVSGRVGPAHPLLGWLQESGLSENELVRFLSGAIPLDVIGFSVYPTSSLKRAEDRSGPPRYRMPYAEADVIEKLAKLYHERYGRPMLLSETASTGTVARRRQWMDESVQSVARLRDQGIPLVGYAWWPAISAVAWSYRNAHTGVARHLVKSGLWDLDERLDRQPTPLIEAYRSLANAGATRAGQLNAVSLL